MKGNGGGEAYGLDDTLKVSAPLNLAPLHACEPAIAICVEDLTRPFTLTICDVVSKPDDSDGELMPGACIDGG